jgi:phosphoribosylaminoimidazolecarboxamide formyltransferase/IMP cyclohydrolase
MPRITVFQRRKCGVKSVNLHNILSGEMTDRKKIKSALISVFYKDNLAPIVKQLNALGVTIYSTGGTQKFIEENDVPVERVEDLTSYPSILGGRVKTLHPKVFGGILARRELQSDLDQLQEFKIPEIDLVIVDLYPFEETVASGATEQEIIEKIDIGGISLIRAAAKNFKDVLIVSSRNQYSDLSKLLDEKSGDTDREDRRHYAAQAFNVSSHYDTQIFNYFNSNGEIQAFKQSMTDANVLRYGENPHQTGIFYGNLDEMFEQLNGKALSYNNLLDIDAAINIMTDFNGTESHVAILKHNNACGMASRGDLLTAWNDALAADPVSAFGGIIVVNKTVDLAAAEEMHKLFFEVLIAPAFDAAALELLKAKKNRILLVQKQSGLPQINFRTSLNGILVQDKDLITDKIEDFETVTNAAPTEEEKVDLEFANKLVKHTKSNTIVFAKGKQLLASGTGQTSRVDALKQAVNKAKAFGFDLHGAVMASDAFFPFADCVELAHNEGIRAVIQPGGSMRDKDSIAFCDENDMAMVFTGNRHFKH